MSSAEMDVSYTTVRRVLCFVSLSESFASPEMVLTSGDSRNE